MRLSNFKMAAFKRIDMLIKEFIDKQYNQVQNEHVDSYFKEKELELHSVSTL